MSHEQVLLDRVGALRARIRLLIAQQWLCAGLAYAALAGLLLVAATRFQWWTDAVDYLWALLLLGGITGLILGWTRHITPLVAAQIADERAGLKERLSTAIELSAQPERSEIARAQIADAAQHAAQMQPAQVLPWRAPRQLRWLAAAAAVLAAALILPDLPLFHSAQERVDREVMRAEGERIHQVAKEIEKKVEKRKKGDEDATALRRIAQHMKQLGKDEARGRISKKQAMLQMNDLQKQLKDAENRMAGSNGGKSGTKTSDRIASDLNRAAQRQLQQGNQEGAKSLQQMAANLQKGDLEGAKRQLEEMARKMQSGNMSADDAQKAADTLRQMAESMQGSSFDKASDQLKEAAKQLQQAAQQAKQLQQQMSQAKSEGERQKLKEQMSQALSQGMQQAAQQAQKAGGT